MQCENEITNEDTVILLNTVLYVILLPADRKLSKITFKYQNQKTCCPFTRMARRIKSTEKNNQKSQFGAKKAPLKRLNKPPYITALRSTMKQRVFTVHS